MKRIAVFSSVLALAGAITPLERAGGRRRARSRHQPVLLVVRVLLLKAGGRR